MNRALIRILVGVAVGLGLTLTTATTTAAAPAPSDRASAAAPDCSTHADALAKARDNYGQRNRVFTKARNALKKAKRAEKRAKTRKAKRAKHKVLVRAKKRVKAQRTKLRSARANVATKKAALERCQNTPTPTPAPTAASPIQVLCDRGIPQQVCTELAVLTGGTLQTTLGELCTAVPDLAPLCDVLGGRTPGSAELEGLVTELHGILDGLGLADLLDDVLGEIGLPGLIGQSTLDALLDQLDLGGGLIDIGGGLLG